MPWGRNPVEAERRVFRISLFLSGFDEAACAVTISPIDACLHAHHEQEAAAGKQEKKENKSKPHKMMKKRKVKHESS